MSREDDKWFHRPTEYGWTTKDEILFLHYLGAGIHHRERRTPRYLLLTAYRAAIRDRYDWQGVDRGAIEIYLEMEIRIAKKEYVAWEQHIRDEAAEFLDIPMEDMIEQSIREIPR